GCERSEIFLWEKKMNVDRTHLLQTLVKRFDEAELRTLCFNLDDVDFDSLRYPGKTEKARELVQFMERRERLDELAAAIESFFSLQDHPAATDVASTLDQDKVPEPTPTYHLVDIRISDAASEDAASEKDVYLVELTVPGQHDSPFPRGQLWLDKHTLEDLSADSEAYGRALGEALFAEQAIGGAYRQTLAVFQSHNRKARIRLRLDPPALHDVRWERIYHPIAGSWYPLAATTDTLLSRYVPVQTWGQSDPLTVRPLRALVILASPNNLDEYNLSPISDVELAAWHAIFDDQPNVTPTYLESATPNPPTLDHVRRALMDGYHIAHFVCHGAKTRQGTALYLENAEGAVEAVHSKRLLEMFRTPTTPLYLCFLAACESGSHGRSDAFIPLGPTLVAEGRVPAVVAMTERVGIITAREFAHQFYDRVLTHGVVDLAVHQARAIVRDRGDWSVPVLFSSLPDNQLFGASGGLIQKPELDSPVSTSTKAPPAPNPFGDTGRITDPDRFFGREELLRQIFEELGKGANLSLVGESQVGKSSLLSMVCVLGPERMSLPPETFAYLSLQLVDNEDDFYLALCDALKLPEPLRGYKLTRALRGKQHVLCLDEMEKMTWDGFTVRVRSQLRGLADGPAAPLRLVIASRSPLPYLFPDSPELDSPLAGICHQLDVGPFLPQVARAFLAHRLRSTNVTFTENEITTMITQTGGHPAKLQRAAADLYRAKKPGFF
ncbi:MAG: CHAT domain-containing protein, partial [Anaerolineae bacterium]